MLGQEGTPRGPANFAITEQSEEQILWQETSGVQGALREKTVDPGREYWADALPRRTEGSFFGQLHSQSPRGATPPEPTLQDGSITQPHSRLLESSTESGKGAGKDSEVQLKVYGSCVSWDFSHHSGDSW